MSEERVYERSFSVRVARIRGKILTAGLRKFKVETYPAGDFVAARVKVEVFLCEQFAKENDVETRNFYPKPPVYTPHRREYLRSMYRVRLDGKWYSPSGYPYHFFTREEIFSILFDEVPSHD